MKNRVRDGARTKNEINSKCLFHTCISVITAFSWMKLALWLDPFAK